MIDGKTAYIIYMHHIILYTFLYGDNNCRERRMYTCMSKLTDFKYYSFC